MRNRLKYIIRKFFVKKASAIFVGLLAGAIMAFSIQLILRDHLETKFTYFLERETQNINQQIIKKQLLVYNLANQQAIIGVLGDYYGAGTSDQERIRLKKRLQTLVQPFQGLNGTGINHIGIYEYDNGQLKSLLDDNTVLHEKVLKIAWLTKKIATSAPIFDKDTFSVYAHYHLVTDLVSSIRRASGEVNQLNLPDNIIVDAQLALNMIAGTRERLSGNRQLFLINKEGVELKIQGPDATTKPNEFQKVPDFAPQALGQDNNITSLKTLARYQQRGFFWRDVTWLNDYEFGMVLQQQAPWYFPWVSLYPVFLISSSMFGLFYLIMLSYLQHKRNQLRQITKAAFANAEIPIEGDIVLPQSDNARIDAAFSYIIDKLQFAYNATNSSEKYFRALMENSFDTILIVGYDGKVKFESDSRDPLLGYDLGSMMQTNVMSLIHPADKLSIVKHFVKKGTLSISQLPSDEVFVRTARFKHKDGSWHYIEAMIKNLLNEPSVNGIVVNCRDITDRKSWEEGLVAAKEHAETLSALKTSLIHNMTHEIRTPLTGILGFASILVEDLPAEFKDIAALIERSGNRLLHTLNSVLDLAQLESGVLEPKREPIKIDEFVTDCVATLSALANEKNIQLDLNIDANVGKKTFLSDEGCVLRIINNLVGNAIKFTDQGSVLVSVEMINSTDLVLSVKDTGVGIESAFLPQLFSEFHQESNGVRRSHEGSGLGLAITKKLVDILGGKILVDSEKGEGSQFVVYLPGLFNLLKSNGTGKSKSDKSVVLICPDPVKRAVISGLLQSDFNTMPFSLVADINTESLPEKLDFIVIAGRPADIDEIKRQIKLVPFLDNRTNVIIYTSGIESESFNMPSNRLALPYPVTKKELYDTLIWASYKRQLVSPV